MIHLAVKLFHVKGFWNFKFVLVSVSLNENEREIERIRYPNFIYNGSGWVGQIPGV